MYFEIQPQPKQMETLPNEMLASILNNIEIGELIYLRRVNKRWQGVIEAMSNPKRSLQLKIHIDSDCSFDYFWLNGKDFMSFQLKLGKDEEKFLNSKEITLSAEFCALLPKLFPNLEALVIGMYGLAMNLNRPLRKLPRFEKMVF